MGPIHDTDPRRHTTFVPKRLQALKAQQCVDISWAGIGNCSTHSRQRSLPHSMWGLPALGGQKRGVVVASGGFDSRPTTPINLPAGWENLILQPPPRDMTVHLFVTASPGRWAHTAVETPGLEGILWGHKQPQTVTTESLRREVHALP